jgi:hypothetical protein
LDLPNQRLKLTGHATDWTGGASGGYNPIFPSMRMKLMAASQRRYTKEEFARRGDALVQCKVRHQLTPADEGKCVAIDVEPRGRESTNRELEHIEELLRKYYVPPGSKIV